MGDLSRKAKKRKKEQATPATEALPNYPQVRFVTPSQLQLEIPSQTNTSLPVWDAMHSQQVDIVWTVTPYSINVHFTPLLAKSAQTQSKSNTLSTPQMSVLPPDLSQPHIIIQPLPQQMSSTQPQSTPSAVLVLTFPQYTSQPGGVTAVPHQPQNMTPSPLKCTSLILPVPLIITQPQPVSKPTTTPAKRGSSVSSSNQPQPSPAKPSSFPPKPPICRPFHTNGMPVQICERFLAGLCRTGRKCKQHHTPYPFHWQLWCLESHQWVDLSPCSQLRMERVYCDVDRDWIYINEGDDPDPVFFSLDFDKMALGVGSKKYDGARRLSNTTDPARNPHLHTTWHMNWRSSHGWQEYREDVSKILLDKMDSSLTPQCSLHIGSQEYKVDFILMLQTNVTTGFQRSVRCRPTFRSPTSMEPHLKTGVQSVFTTTPNEPPPANFSVDPLEEFSTWYPPVWTLVPDQDYSMVDVPSNSLAYQKVYSMFHKSLSETKVEIVSIQQIQNVLHWDKYQRYPGRPCLQEQDPLPLFTLYSEFKNSQHFKALAEGQKSDSSPSAPRSATGEPETLTFD